MLSVRAALTLLMICRHVRISNHGLSQLVFIQVIPDKRKIVLSRGSTG